MKQTVIKKWTKTIISFSFFLLLSSRVQYLTVSAQTFGSGTYGAGAYNNNVISPTNTVAASPSVTPTTAVTTTVQVTTATTTSAASPTPSKTSSIPVTGQNVLIPLSIFGIIILGIIGILLAIKKRKANTN